MGNSQIVDLTTEDTPSIKDINNTLAQAANYGILMTIGEQTERSSAQRKNIQDFLNRFMAISKREPISSKPNKKRKALVLHENPVCVHCEERYNPARNLSSSCRSHSGEMEPDWQNSYWADFDEDCHAQEYDSHADPEAWQWSCCDKNAHAKPCRIGRRSGNSCTSTKRQKPWEDRKSGSSDEDEDASAEEQEVRDEEEE